MFKKKFNQSSNITIFDFDSSCNALNIQVTTTQGTNFSLNPFYSCRPRRGYSLSTDPFNVWKKQEEPADYSRKDIMRAYRLGECY